VRLDRCRLAGAGLCRYDAAMRTVTVVSVLLSIAAACAAAEQREGDPLKADQIDARIRRHRTAEVTLTVTDAAGRALPNKEVVVRQERHKFLFGCNAYMIGRCRKPELERAYRKRFADLLNYATLPFYWGAYEPAEGSPARAGLAKMFDWCRGRGIRTKGHPLCWHEVAPRWLGGKKLDDVEAAQWGRVTRDVTAFAGRIDTWDVVNEAVVMPGYGGGKNPIGALCKRLGQVELAKRAFAAARRANPKATLLLNDFITSPKYEKLLRDCLAAGVTIDVIGIQSHMHRRFWGVRRAWDVCQRFAKLGKPLHFTELTILSGKLKTDDDWNRQRSGWDSTPEGEKRQAEQVEALYRVLFSHPAVEAVTWWDFSDLGAWQGAPAGLVRRDMSPKPAYDALMRLVKKDWWTGELKLTTDGAGKVRFRGFLGTYSLSAGKAAARFELGKAGKIAATAVLK